MSQLEIIPLKILEFKPYPQQLTAHAVGRALGDDGNYYIVKKNGIDEHVCATEWLCSSIADSLNLPVAPSKILSDSTGELFYGAQEVSPRLPDVEVEKILVGHAQNTIFIPSVSTLLSAGYALDLAIGNLDRHIGNFLVSDSGSSEFGQRVGHLRLIDFGSADILHSRKISLPFPPKCNTVRIGREIRSRHKFDDAAARSVIARLRNGKRFIADRALIGIPDQWLTKDGQHAFSTWVQGIEFLERLDRIEAGLSDGTYL